MVPHETETYYGEGCLRKVDKRVRECEGCNVELEVRCGNGMFQLGVCTFNLVKQLWIFFNDTVVALHFDLVIVCPRHYDDESP